MARNRKKDYAQGDRINIYLSRDVPSEFIDWINKQSDLSNFFLFAAQKLYEQTGFVDVSEIMPRKINFNLSRQDEPPAPKTYTEEQKTLINYQEKPEIQMPPMTIKQEDHEKSHKENTEETKEAWSSLSDDFDDPFA